uniref:Uncharacterized protein n=1 Tax=Arundo donax TaxID=35708 RepID=A0A0A9AHC0_ARUDO
MCCCTDGRFHLFFHCVAHPVVMIYNPLLTWSWLNAVENYVLGYVAYAFPDTKLFGFHFLCTVSSAPMIFFFNKF